MMCISYLTCISIGVLEYKKKQMYYKRAIKSSCSITIFIYHRYTTLKLAISQLAATDIDIKLKYDIDIISKRHEGNSSLQEQ